MMRISSALRAVELRQLPPPLIIGERLNSQGSKRAKKFVLDGDYDGLVEIGRAQVEDGAHCLDVCVATTERDDEKQFMTELVKRLSATVPAPLVIDSTDPDVIEQAVRCVPGLPVINSINLEGDGSRFESMAPIMKKYGVPAVAMCIGPEGMAASPAKKLEVAGMLIKRGKKYGLRQSQFIFDVLTFPLSTGKADLLDSGKNTLEGIKLVKAQFPESYTVLGLSNVSFGLLPQSRRTINSVFLYHAVKCGLDCAILNAKEILPYAQIPPLEVKLAEDLIFNAHPDAMASLVDHFESLLPASATSKPEVDPSWPAGRRSYHRIVHRLPEGIERDVICAISEKIPGKPEPAERDGNLIVDAPAEPAHEAALQTLNEDLLPAMKKVGELFGAGELILPFVLRSAECMKAAVTELEKYLIKKEGVTKGKLVLGTVYGDVHDIGKNLVKTIFVNNGYTVYDLGKQVPLQKFLEKIEEVGPDAVGLSALLVSTSQQMGVFVEHARENNLNIPVLCGGAAINGSFISRIAKKGGIYEPGVFYCNTMFAGLKTMERIVSDKENLLREWRIKVESWQEKTPKPAGKVARSSVRPVEPPLIPEKRIIRLDSDEIDMDIVWKLLGKRSLFKLSWGLRGKAGRASESEHEVLLEQWKGRIKKERLFEPSVVYGYFECSPDGEHLMVEHQGENIIFNFPRSIREAHLCVSDYFGEKDVVAFQAVTVGSRVASLIDEWNAQDRYTDAYYLHGLAVESAEALADWVTARIRADLKIKSGLRYSWGYPSCPDLYEHAKVWKILEPQKSGMTLTEAGQIVPEQSTAGIFVHHPKASYFE